MAYIFKTSKTRSDLMRKIKSKNTLSEIKLRKHLWRLGLRYRINLLSLPGKPDIVFTRKKVVIFIDGEFWHGKNWAEKKLKIKDNRDYWIKKIERNIKRDESNLEQLISLGYTVIRFWDNDVKRNVETCVEKIMRTLKEK